MKELKVTPFEKNKILGMYTEAKNILEGKKVYPRMALVYPSYVCPHNCPGCLYKEMNSKNPKFMDAKNFPHLLKSLKQIKVKSIEYAGGGEPTFNPNFLDLINLAAKAGFEQGILSNGSMVKGKTADAIAKHFTYARISIDAATEETYNKMHAPSKPEYGFRQIVENLKYLAKKKKETNSPITIGLKILVCKTNFHEIEEIVELCKEIGADYVQFKPLRNAEAELSPEQMAEAETRIKKLKENSSIDVFGSAKGTSSNVKCWLTPIHLLVDPFGDVYICCYYQYRADSMRIGNIFKQSIKEIWFGSRHKEVIKNIKVKECNIYDCRWHFYNEIMLKVIKENKMHINFI